MDSVTQLVLGGAVGYAVMGNRLGRKAAIYGAIYGTLPDLDVLIPYADPIEDFTFHRSFTHSLLIHAVTAPIFAWLMTTVHGHHRRDYWLWSLTIFLIFATHAIIDAFTVYGTQLLWPLTDYPFGISSMFIIDPLYTVPILVAFVAAFISKIPEASRLKLTHWSLLISSIYLAWSMIGKVLVDYKIEDALAKNNIDNVVYESTPAPFTTLLWRFVAVSEDGYYEGYVSIFDSADDVSLYPQSSQYALLEDKSLNWHIQRLQWFTKGLYSVSVENNEVYMTDLRMGIEGSYVFSFKVATLNGESLEPVTIEKVQNRPDIGGVADVFKRIWDPSVDLSLDARQQKAQSGSN